MDRSMAGTFGAGNIDGSVDGERVLEGIGVVEGEALAGVQGLPGVHDAVVEGEALEELRIDERGGGEPAARNVDVPHGAASEAKIEDLDRERRNSVRQRPRFPLENGDVVHGAAPVADPLHLQRVVPGLPRSPAQIVSRPR